MSLNEITGDDATEANPLHRRLFITLQKNVAKLTDCAKF